MRTPFTNLFEQRGITVKDTLSSMDLFGRPTTAGVTVTESVAEGLPTVFACVRVISSAVAQLPLKLYRLAPDGRKSEAADHPLYEVLHDLSNPEMSAFELRALLMSHLLLWGNAYAEIQRNARGEVTALWPLQPWRVRVDRDEQRRLRFTYAGPQQKTWIYDPNRPPLLRLSINSQDGVTGRSVISVLAQSMGYTAALERFGASFFSNGSTFGGILSTEEQIGPEAEEALRKKIEALHQGTDRAHRFLVLDSAFKFERLGIPPEDAQFLESQKFMRSVLCGAFGVPPHMIADLDRATFSNIENESLRWLRDGLESHLVNWESAIRRDLLGPRSFSNYYARFVRNAMVRGDLASRSTALATMRQNGVINANEWRALEEMDPIAKADGGDLYVVNTAAQPTMQAGTAQPTKPT
jgi:HK97 family phage portal protein